jgi:hypothetical protein
MRNSILMASMLACCLSATTARATVLVPADLSELARDARVIARGAVVDVETQWTDDRRTIETVVTLETERYLKGALADRIVQFKVPGGTLGRLRNIVVGAPQFEIGQRVVVFLGTSGPRLPHLLGLSQGVYRVNVTAAGAALVSPSPVLPGTRGPATRGSSVRRPAPLADFERSVQALAGAVR